MKSIPSILTFIINEELVEPTVWSQSYLLWSLSTVEDKVQFMSSEDNFYRLFLT